MITLSTKIPLIRAQKNEKRPITEIILHIQIILMPYARIRT